MNRFHVHLVVDDLQKNIDFYSKMFGIEPSKLKSDYAKWELEDPAVNFAISARGHDVGLNHLGIEVGSESDLPRLRQKADEASAGQILDQADATCCYANSEKHWTTDPQGIAWEHFYTRNDAATFGEDGITKKDACCVPLHTSSESESDACCVPNESSETSGACC